MRAIERSSHRGFYRPGLSDTIAGQVPQSPFNKKGRSPALKPRNVQKTLRWLRDEGHSSPGRSTPIYSSGCRWTRTALAPSSRSVAVLSGVDDGCGSQHVTAYESNKTKMRACLRRQR
ncbi:hypothetical protein GN956_G6448 [Arapaima gigas]